jgi:FAD/FMN-containing dehydrogenase
MAVQETSALHRLRDRHRGPVIAPDDLGYDVARSTFNGMIDRKPAVVTRPLDVTDVVTAVEFAAEQELPVSVRGGGHGVAGHQAGASLETEFGATRFLRLRAVKRQFDPSNVFRFNHNVSPD